MIPGGLLCVVEVTVALLCASLPVYRPLFKRFAPGLTTGTGDSNYYPRYGVNSHAASTYLGPSSHVNTHITSSSARRSSRKGGINITDDISMITHTNINVKWVRVDEDEDDDARLMQMPKESFSASTTHSGGHHTFRS